MKYIRLSMMSNLHLLHIVGNRPQFIKLSTLLRALPSDVQSTILHTGQHYSHGLSKIFFDQLNIPSPHFNLGVGSGSHSYQTAHILLKSEKILSKLLVDAVLIYGDTNSSLAGALTACKLKLPVIHIESGFRNHPLSYSPENTNRILIDHMSTLNFAPTKRAFSNLKKENLHRSTYLTGDITYDAYLHILPRVKELPSPKIKDYILVTAHRPELVDHKKRFSNFIKALVKLSENHTLIFPLHPRTNKNFLKFDLDSLVTEDIIFSTPLGYLEFLNYLLHSKLVLTDSGGVFKEALYAQKPVVHLSLSFPYRDIFSSGRSILTGPDKDIIFFSVKEYLDYDPPPIGDHFGDGHSAEKMVKIIMNFIKR